MLDAEDIGSIYELQELAKLHYYLKAEHPFNPAEVEALLKFQDPLDVARWCWEENTNKYSFPICSLLDQIDAYNRFDSFQEPFDLKQIQYVELMKRLGQNYYAYRESMLSLDKEILFDRSKEIAKMQDAYSYLVQSYDFDPKEVQTMLCLENPLKYMADGWEESVSELLDPVLDDWIQEKITAIPESAEFFIQSEPVSLRERLQKAAQEVHKQDCHEKTPSMDKEVR